jgi:drug/metabolite transporter (DMT)-like permease
LVVQLSASLTLLWIVVAVQRLSIPLRRETLWFALIGLLNPGLALSIWPVEWLQGETVQVAAITLSTWLWALVSGLVYYALAFWFYLVGLKKIPASLAGLFLNLIPIFAVGGAYLFLGERLAIGQWVGAVLILAAVVTILRLHGRDTVRATERLEVEYN